MHVVSGARVGEGAHFSTFTTSRVSLLPRACGLHATTFYPLRRSALHQSRRLHTSKSRQSAGILCYQSAHQALYHTDDKPITVFRLPPFPSDFYVIGPRVGAGTFGEVFTATHKQTGDKFAVKKMPKRFNPDGTLERYYVRRVRNEVDIGNHLAPSLNVAYLYGAYEDAKHVYLLMELCTGGELYDRIKLGNYTEREAARLVTEILRVVAQCHSAGVLFRDIKPENFLFASKEKGAPLKAIDFGISVFCEKGQFVDVRAGTPMYIAPEVLRCRYTLSADMWSVGIVAYQLLTGRLPFCGEEGADVADAFMTGHKIDNKEVFRAILYADLDFISPPWDTLSTSAKEFIKSLLHREEFMRPTAEQALHHPWLVDSQNAASSAADDIPIADTIVQRLQRYGTYGRLRQAALAKVAHAVAEDYSEDSLPAALKKLSALEAVFSSNNNGSSSAADVNGSSNGTNGTTSSSNGASPPNSSSQYRVSVDVLKAELQGGRFLLTAAEADQLINQVHADDNGTIDIDEWTAAMADWRSIRTSLEWDSVVEEAFNALDRDSNGKLTAKEVELLLCGEDGCEAPDVVDAAMREADVDHDGSISLEEFKELVSEKHESDLQLFEARLASDSDSSGSESS